MPHVGHALRLVADSLLAVTLAPRCAACGEVLDSPTGGPVCERCWDGIRPLPSWTGLVSAGPISRWHAAGEYDGALREIVHAFKYDDRRSIARRLGARIREAGGDLLADAACAVPVPLHPWRRLRRGFNQASDLAAQLELPIVHALWRTRATAPQSALHAAARRANVRRAFRLSPLLPRRTRDTLLRDRAVVLVDDVMTTGATLEACAKVLLDAGAGEVRALTAAGVLTTR